MVKNSVEHSVVLFKCLKEIQDFAAKFQVELKSYPSLSFSFPKRPSVSSETSAFSDGYIANHSLERKG